MLVRARCIENREIKYLLLLHYTPIGVECLLFFDKNCITYFIKICSAVHITIRKAKLWRKKLWNFMENTKNSRKSLISLKNTSTEFFFRINKTSCYSTYFINSFSIFLTLNYIHYLNDYLLFLINLFQNDILHISKIVKRYICDFFAVTHVLPYINFYKIILLLHNSRMWNRFRSKI